MHLYSDAEFIAIDRTCTVGELLYVTGQSSSTNLKSRMSPTSSVDANSPPSAPDRQFAIICSEKQARVTDMFTVRIGRRVAGLDPPS